MSDTGGALRAGCIDPLKHRGIYRGFVMSNQEFQVSSGGCGFRCRELFHQIMKALLFDHRKNPSLQCFTVPPQLT